MMAIDMKTLDYGGFEKYLQELATNQNSESDWCKPAKLSEDVTYIEGGRKHIFKKGETVCSGVFGLQPIQEVRCVLSGI